MSLIKKYKFLSKSYNISNFKVIEDVPIKYKAKKMVNRVFSVFFSVFFFLKLQVSYVISFNLT